MSRIVIIGLGAITLDPDCDLDYVPNEARPFVYKTAMVNAFRVGGHYMALLLGRYGSQGRYQVNGS